MKCTFADGKYSIFLELIYTLKTVAKLWVLCLVQSVNSVFHLNLHTELSALHCSTLRLQAFAWNLLSAHAEGKIRWSNVQTSEKFKILQWFYSLLYVTHYVFIFYQATSLTTAFVYSNSNHLIKCLSSAVNPITVTSHLYWCLLYIAAIKTYSTIDKLLLIYNISISSAVLFQQCCLRFSLILLSYVFLII